MPDSPDLVLKKVVRKEIKGGKQYEYYKCSDNFNNMHNINNNLYIGQKKGIKAGEVIG